MEKIIFEMTLNSNDENDRINDIEERRNRKKMFFYYLHRDHQAS